MATDLPRASASLIIAGLVAEADHDRAHLPPRPRLRASREVGAKVRRLGAGPKRRPRLRWAFRAGSGASDAPFGAGPESGPVADRQLVESAGALDRIGLPGVCQSMDAQSDWARRGACPRAKNGNDAPAALASWARRGQFVLAARCFPRRKWARLFIMMTSAGIASPSGRWRGRARRRPSRSLRLRVGATAALQAFEIAGRYGDFGFMQSSWNWKTKRPNRQGGSATG